MRAEAEPVIFVKPGLHCAAEALTEAPHQIVHGKAIQAFLAAQFRSGSANCLERFVSRPKVVGELLGMRFSFANRLQKNLIVFDHLLAERLTLIKSTLLRFGAPMFGAGVGRSVDLVNLTLHFSNRRVLPVESLLGLHGPAVARDGEVAVIPDLAE
jgi:hypothetical protein